LSSESYDIMHGPCLKGDLKGRLMAAAHRSSTVLPCTVCICLDDTCRKNSYKRDHTYIYINPFRIEGTELLTSPCLAMRHEPSRTFIFLREKKPFTTFSTILSLKLDASIRLRSKIICNWAHVFTSIMACIMACVQWCHVITSISNTFGDGIYACCATIADVRMGATYLQKNVFAWEVGLLHSLFAWEVGLVHSLYGHACL
jgi:hypothetical protein